MIGHLKGRGLSSENRNCGESGGEKTRGRPRVTSLDWMMKEDYSMHWT